MRKRWTISVLCAALILPALLSACGADSADAGGTVLSTTNVKEESTTAVTEISGSDMTETASKTTTVTTSAKTNEANSKKITSVKTNKKTETTKKDKTSQNITTTKKDKSGQNITTTKKDKTSQNTTTSKSKATTQSTTIPVPTYPVTIVYKALQGKVIDFNVGAINTFAGNNEMTNVFIAQSYAQLKAIYKQDDNPDHYNYIEKYDNAFFNKKAVVVLLITEPAYGTDVEVNTLTVKDKTLCVSYTRGLPGSDGNYHFDVMTNWRIPLEVDKAAVSDITKIQVYSMLNINWK